MTHEERCGGGGVGRGGAVFDDHEQMAESDAVRGTRVT